jgi:hypothetical protein
MNTYKFNVEQVIEVKGNSLEEAIGLLPVYPYSPNPSYDVVEETIESIEGESE